MQTIIAQNL